MPVLRPVERRHAAEAAVQWTAARRRNRSEGISRGKEIMAGSRTIVYLGQPSVIPALQLVSKDVLKDRRPDILSFPGNDRINTLHNLLYAHCCVNAAHHNGYALIPEMTGQFISAVRLRGKSGNPHKVRPGHRTIVRHTEVLVKYRDYPLRPRQSTQNHKAQWFPHTVAGPSALTGFGDAHKR